MTTINDKQKKLLLVLPLIVIPFMTMFFWALGGGKTAQAQTATGQAKGLNMQLPGARLKNDSAETKLGFYEQAEKDSLKFKQARKDDPYYKADTTIHAVKIDSAHLHDSGIIPKYGIGTSFSGRSLKGSRATLAADEAQINQKLATLNQQINQPTVTQQQTGSSTNNSDSEVNRLQAQIQQLNSNKPDPEMQQLSTMLDKIQEIQNPALARQKLKAQSEKERGTVLPVSGSGNTSDETMMNQSAGSPDNYAAVNGFYDLDHNNESQDANAISAVVHETQTVTAGSTMKLRLLQDIFINGKLIPKSTFVFGTCSIEGERLNIDIKTIRYQNSVFPVTMHVFDADGIAGIYVPGAITRDALKEGTDQAVTSYDPLSYDPSIGAQAATAGIQMAKGLFSKKIKLVKVTVKSGYNVLLLNGNQLNQ